MNVVRAIWDEPLLANEVYEATLTKQTSLNDLKTWLKSINRHCLVYVKVPTSRPELNNFLFSLSSEFLETQLTIRRKLEFDPIVQTQDKLLSGVKFRLANDEDISVIKENISAGLFETDRISLDLTFGKEVAATRYAHWLDVLISDVKSSCYAITNNEEFIVGFFTISLNENSIIAPLGGIFNKYQNSGISHSIVHFPIKYGIENNYRYLNTKISLVNEAVLKIYCRLYKFEIIASHNVFKIRQ